MSSYVAILSLPSYSHARYLVSQASRFFGFPTGVLVAQIDLSDPDHALAYAKGGLYTIFYHQKIADSCAVPVQDVTLFLEGCRKQRRIRRASGGKVKAANLAQALDDVRALQKSLDIAITSRNTILDDLASVKDKYHSVCTDLSRERASSRSEGSFSMIVPESQATEHDTPKCKCDSAPYEHRHINVSVRSQFVTAGD